MKNMLFSINFLYSPLEKMYDKSNGESIMEKLLGTSILNRNEFNSFEFFMFEPMNVLINDPDTEELKLKVHPSWVSEEGIETLEKLRDYYNREFKKISLHVEYSLFDTLLVFLYTITGNTHKILDLSITKLGKTYFYGKSAFKDKRLDIVERFSHILDTRVRPRYGMTMSTNTQNLMNKLYNVSNLIFAYGFLKAINGSGINIAENIDSASKVHHIMNEIERNLYSADVSIEIAKGSEEKEGIQNIRSITMNEFAKFNSACLPILRKHKRSTRFDISHAMQHDMEAAISAYGIDSVLYAILETPFGSFNNDLVDFISRDEESMKQLVSFIGTIATNNRKKDETKNIILRSMLRTIKKTFNASGDIDRFNQTVLESGVAELFAYLL